MFYMTSYVPKNDIKPQYNLKMDVKMCILEIGDDVLGFDSHYFVHIHYDCNTIFNRI